MINDSKLIRLHDLLKIISIAKKNSETVVTYSGSFDLLHSGHIKSIQKAKKQGDILVTKMTDPDYVVAMKKACAIITDEGGITAHAAIVSRELGIPAVVGTEKATHTLHDGEIVTVDGNTGKIYMGDLGIKTEKVEEWHGEKLQTKTKIYMNLGEPELAEKYKHLPSDN